MPRPEAAAASQRSGCDDAAAMERSLPGLISGLEGLSRKGSSTGRRYQLRRPHRLGRAGALRSDEDSATGCRLLTSCLMAIVRTGLRMLLFRVFCLTMTEQEEIAVLRGQPIPDIDGFVFGDETRKDGDSFDLDVVRESDGLSVPTARGTTVAEVVQQAQAIARDE